MEYTILFGIAIMFGLALIMTVITFKDVETFFIWLCVFSAFVVWGGFLPLWVLIACFLIIGLIIMDKLRNRGNV